MVVKVHAILATCLAAIVLYACNDIHGVACLCLSWSADGACHEVVVTLVANGDITNGSHLGGIAAVSLQIECYLNKFELYG